MKNNGKSRGTGSSSKKKNKKVSQTKKVERLIELKADRPAYGPLLLRYFLKKPLRIIVAFVFFLMLVLNLGLLLITYSTMGVTGLAFFGMNILLILGSGMTIVKYGLKRVEHE